jgi:excisionase family DNA binding protein
MMMAYSVLISAYQWITAAYITISTVHGGRSRRVIYDHIYTYTNKVTRKIVAFYGLACYNITMERLVSIGKAAKILGVSEITLRRWDKDGRLPSIKTEGGHRRYDISKLKPEAVHKYSFADNRKTVAYARVSGHDQKENLERQKQVLELYCEKNGWSFEIIADLGSGMNYHKKGLKRLLSSILDGNVGRLVLTHKDRLLRFGAELVFAICEAKGVEVVIINKGEDTTFEEDLATDVLEIITVFSARLYGARSKKNKKLLEGVAKVVEEVADVKSTQD